MLEIIHTGINRCMPRGGARLCREVLCICRRGAHLVARDHSLTACAHALASACAHPACGQHNELRKNVISLHSVCMGAW